jgi:hypothetical protein
MALCGCGLPAHCCQPALAGGIIYADLRGELSTHLALQTLFTQSSVHDATVTSFPLSMHTGGGDTAPAFSGLCVYLQLTWEVDLPPSPVEFSSHCHFYKLSHSCLLGMCCCCSCLLRPGLFVYSSRGKWVFPPFPVEFSSLCPFYKLSCSRLLGVCRHSCLLQPGLFIYSSVSDPLPHSLVLSAPHPLCYMSLLFLLLITQFLFFPWVGVGLPRGLC